MIRKTLLVIVGFLASITLARAAPVTYRIPTPGVV